MMKRLSARLLPLLAVLALFGASRAQADQIGFGYSWSSMPPTFITGGTGTVQIATPPDATGQATLGGPSVSIPAATLSTNTSATAQNPDSFKTNFSLNLNLTDTASSTMKTLTFNGTVSGTLSVNQSSLFATFQNPLTQNLTFGNLVYTVTIDPSHLHLPTPGAPNLGQINADVSVASATAATTPEPSSFLLGAIALSMAGLVRRARRKPLAV
jgi:hypothetical protein